MITWPIQGQNLNGISIASAVFAQLTAECPNALQWADLSPSKLPLPMWDLDPHPRHGSFLRPKWVFNPNGISIGLVVFAGLTTVTNDRPTDSDRLTDRPCYSQYSVCNTRLHLHS